MDVPSVCASSGRIAAEQAARFDVKSVHLNQTISTATGGEVKSSLRPDVQAVRTDDRVEAHEVLSPGQIANASAAKYSNALGNKAALIVCSAGQVLKMGNHQSIYALDSGHPIPNLDVVDINTVKKGGGSDLFIVVAMPLSGDQRSLKRLLRKVGRYLEFMRTEEFLAVSGTASLDNTNIVVKLHPHSDRAAFELLERSKPWVAGNCANLLIDTQLFSSY